MATNLNSAIFIKLATNSTGTNVTVQVTPSTNSSYNHCVLIYRPIGKNEISNISTNSIVSGSVTLSNLTERRPYEIIAVPVLDDGNYDPFVSNRLIVIPTTGSIREKILDYCADQVLTVFDEENTLIVSNQIQQGYLSFQGKFRGIKGAAVIDASSVSVEPYTNAARLITYSVSIHVGWQDRRRATREDELGQAAEDLRLLLDASQDSSIPNVIITEVREIPFSSDVFDLGEHIRGFGLEVDFEVQEPIET